MAEVDLMARDPTVSDHLTNQGFRAMGKAVMPERHGVIHSGMSDQGRLRMVRNVTVEKDGGLDGGGGEEERRGSQSRR